MLWRQLQHASWRGGSDRRSCPHQRQQVLDQLSASIDQFFASGGKPTELPGSSFEPRPTRPISADAVVEESGPPEPGSRSEINLVSDLTKILTAYPVEASAIERARLLQLSKAHLIRFQVSSTKRRSRATMKKAREDQKAEHCKQLPGAGRYRGNPESSCATDRHELRASGSTN